MIITSRAKSYGYAIISGSVKKSEQSMMVNKKLVVPLSLALLLLGAQTSVSSASSELYLRLVSTRDALLGQERDLRKSYDDYSRQIDELRQKQSVVQSYMTQTRSAIRDVERAMGDAQ
jgi:hypothetical protein